MKLKKIIAGLLGTSLLLGFMGVYSFIESVQSDMIDIAMAEDNIKIECTSANDTPVVTEYFFSDGSVLEIIKGGRVYFTMPTGEVMEFGNETQASHYITGYQN